MGTTQSKAGTNLLPTQSVNRTPSTDIPRADSVESTSKEPQTASPRHATTEEKAGSREDQLSSPGNFGLSGADAEKSVTALFAAHLASKGRGLRKPETLSSRPPYSTPDTPTQREGSETRLCPSCYLAISARRVVPAAPEGPVSRRGRPRLEAAPVAAAAALRPRRPVRRP